MAKIPVLSMRLFACAVIVWMTANIAAQPKALISLQPERMETGDTASLLVFVTGVNTAPKDPDFSSWATLLPAKNILNRAGWRRSAAQWTRRYTLIAFDSAVLELPPLQVQLATGERLATNSLKLIVYPTRGGREISDMAGIREIKREPVHWTDYWPWAAGSALFLLAFGWWWKRKQPKPTPLVQPIQTDHALSVSPVEIALQQLSQLEQKQYWKYQQVKTHYAELSLILREYIEKSQHVAAMESTTAEIAHFLAQTTYPVENRATLINLLKMADGVKYAQSQPPESEHQNAIATARKLIVPPVMMKSGHPPKTSTKSPSSAKKYEPL
ncbi:MAG: hypothetical protein SFV22_11820 [Saprospiraceae bacterium]|nr:hypothetical protein [Saprospiraceae bacterium]